MNILKSATMVLALAGTALVTLGTASAGSYDNGRVGDRNNHPVIAAPVVTAPAITVRTADNDYVYGRDRYNTAITIGFGDIAVGYRDGFWDSRHNWHRWRHTNDYRTYRDANGSHFHDGYHRHFNENGWEQR